MFTIYRKMSNTHTMGGGGGRKGNSTEHTLSVPSFIGLFRFPSKCSFFPQQLISNKHTHTYLSLPLPSIKKNRYTRKREESSENEEMKDRTPIPPLTHSFFFFFFLLLFKKKK